MPTQNRTTAELAECSSSHEVVEASDASLVFSREAGQGAVNVDNQPTMSANTRVLISVLLVDDHAVVREGYRRLLEQYGDIAVVAEARDAEQAYRLYREHSPHVVVMDITLPGLSGLECLRRILTYDANARVLIFSMHEDAIFAKRALSAGALGYITKSSAPEIMLEAVHAIAGGQRYLDPHVAQRIALGDILTQPKAVDRLSAREFEVLTLLVQGLDPSTIAAKMNLSPKTVANHQTAIKQKLQVSNPIQLLRVAMSFGLSAPPDCASESK